MEKRTKEKHNIFIYSWAIDKHAEEHTHIRAYGLNSKNESVCISMADFTPYVYVELPTHMKWTQSFVQILGNSLDERMGKRYSAVKKCLQFKKKLYYANVNIKKDEEPVYKQYPYLLMSFYTIKSVRMLQAICKKPMQISGIGKVYLHVHEWNASPILQLTCVRNIPTAGWVSFIGKKSKEVETTCNYEYDVKYKNLFPVENDKIPNPMVLSYDIEAYSSNPIKFPDANKPKDKVFQISCILSREGSDDYESFLLTLGEPDEEVFDEEIEMWCYSNESSLLEGFAEFIIEKNPEIITGYNIFGFDIPYMIARAKNNFIISSFDKQGMLKDSHAEEKTIKWTSQAYKDQEFVFLDAEGRLYVDLLPIVRRDYKFDTYTLKSVSAHFIGETKDPLTARDIFRCYELGLKGGDKGNKAMGVVGKYCVKDSILVAKLFKILQVWVGLCEMAKTCGVPIFSLYTQGQQIKVFSQIYKECMYSGFVVEKLDLVPGENEKYQGATVFPPKPGLYDKVDSF